MNAALRENGTWRRAAPWARLLAAGLVAASLGGCGSISEKMSETIAGMPAVGLPAGVPERPSEVRAYPAVHDMPPPRTTAVLTSAEQRRLESELVSAREGQKTAAKEPEPEAVPQPAPKPPAAARKRPASKPESASVPSTVPASSSRMIY